MDSREVGRAGEDAAVHRLEAEGYAILGRNLRFGHDEIDIVAENDAFLCFVEVKTRRQAPDAPRTGFTPGEAVDDRKRTALVRAAEAYLRAHPTEKAPRIDVMEVYAEERAGRFCITAIRHFENAVTKTAKFSPKRRG